MSQKIKRNKAGPRSQQALATDALGEQMIAMLAQKKMEELTSAVTRSVYVEEKYEIEETRPQRDIILEENGQVLDDLIFARNWEYKKWGHFLLCFLCNIVGVACCLASFGQTVLFAQFPKSTPLLIAGCLCFIPFFIWIKVVYFPHGAAKIHLAIMSDKRATRRYEEKQRRLHLDGRLPRPLKIEEDKTLPFEYDPDEPWMYNRWKEKPKLRVWYDDEGLAHKIEPGSIQEAMAMKEEAELNRIMQGTLNNSSVRGKSGGKKGDEEKENDDEEYDDMEGGRKSSAQDDGRRSSAEDLDNAQRKSSA